MASDYCGCCGRECAGDWCARCRDHVLPPSFGLPMWDRTYFAQFERDCPFQIGDNEKFNRSQGEAEAGKDA